LRLPVSVIREVERGERRLLLPRADRRL